ncbi:MAG: hypothetical protein Q7S86_02350, partial [bacterium]|nr:hypothetical protein [bacterium]
KDKNDHRSVGSKLEIHISDDGMALVRGAKVTAIAGNVISASTVWGSTSLLWTIQSDSATNVIRRSGGQSNLSEISIGDFVSFQGKLVTTSGNLTVNAKILKNWSVQKKNVSFIGKVLSLGANSFVLSADEHGQVTVNTASAVITKNDAAVTLAVINIGDKVMAKGLFDETLRVLSADKVKVYVDKASEQHVFEGKLKAIAGTTLPTSITLTLGDDDNKDVTVNIPAGISIVGRFYLTVSLSDFKVGDKVRVWGLREGTTIDATVVRNVNLPR